MTKHRFRTGQSVRLTQSGRDTGSLGKKYEIVQQLPLEGAELLYRIKSKDEPCERMARECELSRVV